MVTMDEVWSYLNKKYNKILTPSELVDILNGCGLLTVKEAIEETKKAQKNERPV
jgi:hypothetical protein